MVSTSDAVSEIDFKYLNGKFSMTGSFEYDAGVRIETITVLGVMHKPKGPRHAEYDAENKGWERQQSASAKPALACLLVQFPQKLPLFFVQPFGDLGGF